MSDRSERALAILQSLAASFILEEANTSPLITVTRVTASRDFRNATVYVTCIPDDEDEAVISFLKRRGSDFREFIKERGRLKRIPFFDFAIDYGEKNRQHLDEVARRVEDEEANS